MKVAMKNLPADSRNPSPFHEGQRSPLLDLPFGETNDPTKYIRIDPAHTYAIDGIGKDYLASSIVMLMRMGHFGGGSINHSFSNAYANFIAFCNAYGKKTSISEFSSTTFKLPMNSLLAQLKGIVLIFDASYKNVD